jgi:PAS domain S-box-containing protein
MEGREPAGAGLDGRQLRTRLRDLETALARQQAEVTGLTAELDATNRGLIALHAELEAARESEARLAAIVRASDDAMYSLTPVGTVVTWNAGAERLLGYGAREIVGQPVHALIPAAELPAFLNWLERLRAGVPFAHYDGWRRRKDGSFVEVAVTQSAIRSGDGELLGYAAVLRDLTQRRRTEEELARARAEHEVSADRERIARDLHDLIIQRLFAAGMFLQSALDMSDRAALEERLQRVIGDLNATIADLRSTILALGHGPGEGGLRAHLLRLAADTAAALGFRPQVRLEGPIDSVVPPEAAEHVLAVAREALANVVRHAHASAVEISLRVGPEIVLEVRDNGRGMGGATRSSGTTNMATRAADLGGALRITQATPCGTRLEWRVPLTR